MGLRIEIVTVLGTLVLLAGILELVRRRALLERYALLWLFSALVLLGLGLWQGLLKSVATALGIYYAPSALFVVAFAFVLVLLLHFSVAVSRLADQNKVLAQRLALLEARQRELEDAHQPSSVAPGGLAGAGPAPASEPDRGPSAHRLPAGERR